MGGSTIGKKQGASHAGYVVAKGVEKPTQPKKLVEAKGPSGPAFEAAKKKLMSITGKHPAPNSGGVDRPDLKATVASLRSSAQAGTVSTKAAAPKLDPEVTWALKTINLNAGRTDKVQLVGEQMKELTPDQQKQLYENLPRAIRTQVDHDLDGGTIAPAGLSLARVGTMTDSQLAETAALIRAGVRDDDIGLQLAVATELAARTQWGKDNPDIVEHQKQMITEGKVNYAAGRGAARTETSGEITLDPKLKNSPEGLAATLAHEGTHSYNATHGGMSASVYEEETAGNLVSARVFSEIGDPNDSNLPTNTLEGLNDLVGQYKKFGEDGVQARMAAEYASEAGKAYEKGSKSDNKAKVNDIVEHLAADPGAQQAMKADYIYEIVLATARTGGLTEADLTRVGQALKGAPAAEKIAALKKLTELDAAALKVLTAAMTG